MEICRRSPPFIASLRFFEMTRAIRLVFNTWAHVCFSIQGSRRSSSILSMRSERQSVRPDYLYAHIFVHNTINYQPGRNRLRYSVAFRRVRRPRKRSVRAVFYLNPFATARPPDRAIRSGSETSLLILFLHNIGSVSRRRNADKRCDVAACV